jgi:NAD(P)-dependent dehydrogenase (short-subunit alcohol dehydrogenase family)
MHRFEDKVALITGAASGIGRASALRLGREGARLALADVAAEALEAVAKEARELGAEAETFVADVSDEDSVKGLVRGVVERFERLDVVCNIAGILRFDHTHELTLEDWNRILAVNLTGTFLVCREAIPHLLATRGTIVNMASSAALAGHPWTAAYSASKGGVLSFTRGLAIEYGKQGLRANAICPGGVETPIHRSFHVPEGANPKLLRRIMPFTGFTGPEDVASAVAFLASDDARHVNGDALRVDGGMLT